MRISAQQYAKSLHELTEQKSHSEIDGVIESFLKVLRKNRHLKLATKIMAKFSEIYNQKNSIVEAEVITKCDMGNGTSDKVKSFIKEKYQAKEVVLNNKIDLNIKGGIIIKVRDEILDGSVARQLHELRSELVK